MGEEIMGLTIFLQLIIFIISLGVQYFVVLLGVKKAIETTIEETIKLILNEMRDRNKWEKK